MTDGERIENELWRQVLTGEHPAMKKGRRRWKMLPTDPRCKLCNAPFAGLGAIVARARDRAPANKNPRFCNFCERFAQTHKGGAEVEITMAFADIRGSTELAQTMTPAEFSEQINSFYREATRAVTEADGFVDKLVGDEIVGLYVPALSGDDHACRAIKAFDDLLRSTGHGTNEGPWLPVGAGIHTGPAFVGTVGGEGRFTDFTALGDTVNLAARLASVAAAGEILFTDATRDSCGEPLAAGERREVMLKGISDPVTANVMRVAA